MARSSLSDPALAYQSIGPGSSPAYTNEYFQYLSVLFCSAQEIKRVPISKSLPPIVVAHDLSSLCDFKQIKKEKKKIYINNKSNNINFILLTLLIKLGDIKSARKRKVKDEVGKEKTC
ncbi:Protein of unknown function [Cotesia congregata]|uniref:Uncharacterized protein n=1 Tax=Cotesia congregata TaxID=51543 RepID=A0A8J2HGH8_COTCN|nr:Protein of unknown function [Cotesia congregata]